MNFSCIDAPLGFAAVLPLYARGQASFLPEGRGTPFENNSSDRSGHGTKKFRVRFRLGEAAQKQLHGLDGRKRAQHLTQYPHPAQLIRWEKQLVLTSAGALDINRREHALIGQAPV